MFMVSEADAAAIRAAFDQGGDFEPRQRFPASGLTKPPAPALGRWLEAEANGAGFPGGAVITFRPRWHSFALS